jgi:hypothetical protein
MRKDNEEATKHDRRFAHIQAFSFSVSQDNGLFPLLGDQNVHAQAKSEVKCDPIHAQQSTPVRTASTLPVR